LNLKRTTMTHAPTPISRRRWLGALACAGAAGPAAWRTAQAAEAGQPAPAWTLNGRDGSVGLEAFKGRVVLLDFWASWCGPCRQSFPWMNEMQARHGARGLQVVAINLDRQRAEADTFLAAVPAHFVVAFDPQGDTPRRYAVKGMPTSVLIGADGVVLRQHAGFRDDDKPVLEAAIVAALARPRQGG
jgi:cytochrome c biogenesis protein CcmG, thiol:disulfide interchange protein DsbE